MLDSIRTEKDQLLTQAKREGGEGGSIDRLLGLGERPTPRGFVHAFLLAIRYDFRRRQVRRRIERAAALEDMPAASQGRLITLSRGQLEVEQQIALLKPFQRLFGYWHVAHLPLSFVMFLIMFVHIFIAALFGYAWLGE